MRDNVMSHATAGVLGGEVRGVLVQGMHWGYGVTSGLLFGLAGARGISR